MIAARSAFDRSLETDVVIVGAGATGLLVADELDRAGLRCVVLEAGPYPEIPTRGGLFAVYAATARYENPDFETWKYRAEGLPCEWTRVRAAGGRTLLWGGWCERFAPVTLRDAEDHGAPWPVTAAELRPFYEIAERRFRVRTGRVTPDLRVIERELGLRVEPKRGSVGPGRRRVGTALDLGRGRRAVHTGAVALRVLCGEDSRAAGVEYLAPDGRSRAARGRAVVLCASTVETVRLLLADPPKGLEDRVERVGRGLVDHLVASYLVVIPRPAPPSTEDSLDRAALVPRFVNDGRGDRRDYAGGFSVEVSGPTAVADLGPERLKMLGMTPEFAAGLSFYAVHAIGEMRPHPDRYIDLCPEERDALGRRVPLIHLAWSDEDRKMARDMKETALAIADALAPPGSRIIPFRDPLAAGGLFHESGGCGMGRDPRSVTDPFGEVRGVPGLFVADASVLPTAGDRHPTLTLLALAARTAKRIALTAATESA